MEQEPTTVEQPIEEPQKVSYLSQRRKEILFEGDESDKVQQEMGALLGVPTWILARIILPSVVAWLVLSMFRCSR